ncbi:MAG TPA: peptidoglycan-binding protein [Bryobacteraceae bacterium]|nr:peptidoglycan-binding protein [Bryobacteraceae bacterium]
MNYTVSQGDCIYSIAAQYGFLWKTIWNHPQNAALQQQRQNPGLLLPGDTVFIPDKTPRIESKPTDQQHVFVKEADKFVLRLQLLDRNHNPRTGLSYVLSVDGNLTNGTTDGEGRIEVPISPGASQAQLTVQDQGESEKYQLNLGYVNPIDDSTGHQQRLTNLGLGSGLPQKTALMMFQKKNGLPQTGEMDDATIACLNKIHGS